MKHPKPGISPQKLFVLILTATLSSACAALDPHHHDKPGGVDTTTSLPIDDKLTQALESKNVKMLITLDQDGNFVLMDTKGRHFKECDDKCIGLKQVTVRKVDSPVLLKTIRKSAAMSTQSIPAENCKGEGCSGLLKVGMQPTAAPAGLMRTRGDEPQECFVWIQNGAAFEECW